MHSPSQRLKGVEQIVARRGKLCVISPSSGIFVVDVAAVLPRIFPIWLPEEFEPMAVHILNIFALF
ncbi:F-box/kelch-repeat protein SKIP25 [Glycine soja]|uniref:F-box/kelch-repeat protein SKIP25 n=1 Tax=Glycine soja TaxID=3848 RepID=A0A0B2Q438_GLYSO|nr:F-box/kelch-repeat protein SKIP25 [Glycine soja]